MNQKIVCMAIQAAGLSLLISAAGLAADPEPVMSAKEVKWGAAPPVLPKGAKMAVMAGDPSKSGLIALRLKMPPGYKVPAHWHPTDEHVTVLSGTFSIGMGDKLDETKGHDFTAGGYAVAPAHMNHFAWTKMGATIQVNMMGPFEITYVDPADDPRGSKPK